MEFKQERCHVVPTPCPADKRSTGVLDLLQFAKPLSREAVQEAVVTV